MTSFHLPPGGPPAVITCNNNLVQQNINKSQNSTFIKYEEKEEENHVMNHSVLTEGELNGTLPTSGFTGFKNVLLNGETTNPVYEYDIDVSKVSKHTLSSGKATNQIKEKFSNNINDLSDDEDGGFLRVENPQKTSSGVSYSQQYNLSNPSVLTRVANIGLEDGVSKKIDTLYTKRQTAVSQCRLGLNNTPTDVNSVNHIFDTSLVMKTQQKTTIPSFPSNEDHTVNCVCDTRDKIAYHMKCIMQLLGEDTSREGLLKTPTRVADSLLYLTSGYQLSLIELVNDALFRVENNDLVVISDLPVYSTCEHHLLPFFGKCDIGYIPNGRVLGLSKFSRLLDMFGRRLQVQERLCEQVAEAIDYILKPAGVIVAIKASHMCMMMRGVCKSGSETITRSCRGVFRVDSSARAEFFQICRYTPERK